MNDVNILSAGAGVKEEHIVINPDRTITVPESLKKIGIQFDHNIETVTFDCFRRWDGHDLSKMKIFINYLRSDNEVGSAQATNIETIDDERMTFDWVISQNVTMVNGPLTFIVCIKAADPTDNSMIRHWNSERNTDLYVGEGLAAEPVNETHADIITALLTRMDELETIGLSHVVEVAELDEGYTITLTDSTGSKTVEIHHGRDGIDGVDGADGEKGEKGDKGDKGDTGAMLTEIDLVDGSTIVDPFRKYRITRIDVSDPLITETVSTEYSEENNDYVMPFSRNSVVVGTKMYIFGGFEIALMSNNGFYRKHYSDKIRVYDLNTHAIETLDVKLKCPVTNVSAAVVGTDIYMLYTYAEYNGSPYSTDYEIRVFDTTTNSFKSSIDHTAFRVSGTSTVNYSYCRVAMAAIGTKIYMFGGKRYEYDSSTSSYKASLQSTIYVLDTVNRTVEKLSRTLPRETCDASTAVVGTDIYLFNCDIYSKSMYVFDTVTNNLQWVKNIETKAVHPSTITMGNDIYLIGGLSSHILNDGAVDGGTPTGSIQLLKTDYNSLGVKQYSLETLSIELPNINNGPPISAKVGEKVIVLYPSDLEVTNYRPNPDSEWISTYSYTLNRLTFLPFGKTVQLSLKHTTGTYTFPLYLYDKYFNRFEFEILAIYSNENNTEFAVAYELNGERGVEIITGTDLSLDNCKLVIKDASKVSAYNDDVGPEASTTNKSNLVNGEGLNSLVQKMEEGKDPNTAKGANDVSLGRFNEVDSRTFDENGNAIDLGDSAFTHGVRNKNYGKRSAQFGVFNENYCEGAAQFGYKNKTKKGTTYASQFGHNLRSEHNSTAQFGTGHQSGRSLQAQFGSYAKGDKDNLTEVGNGAYYYKGNLSSIDEIIGKYYKDPDNGYIEITDDNKDTIWQNLLNDSTYAVYELKNAFNVKVDGSAEVQKQGDTENSVVIYKTLTEALGNINKTTINVAQNIVYSELKTLRDTAKLIPGCYYRITDYQCTTKQTNTASANHQFDIIIQALSENKLSETAFACQHEGDTYFEKSNLSAWELKYCIDNDTTRFAWTNTVTGKGVIYWMKDEFNNECPYDFKNILFTKSGVYENAYTFTCVHSDSTKIDASLPTNSANHYCHDNIIKPHYNGNVLQLNFNVFYSMQYPEVAFSCHSNIFAIDCRNNTFGNNCRNNTFGENCYNNTFGNNCYHNVFEGNCYNNIFYDDCIYNSLGKSCIAITLLKFCERNKFGKGNTYIQLGNNSYNNENIYTGRCCDNTFGNNCTGITIRMRGVGNTFGNCCYYDELFENSKYITFENGCNYIQLRASNDKSYTEGPLQNIHIHEGIFGSSTTNKQRIYTDRNLEYSTDYYRSGSQEVYL